MTDFLIFISQMILTILYCTVILVILVNRAIKHQWKHLVNDYQINTHNSEKMWACNFLKYIYWLCYYSCLISRLPHSTPSCTPLPSHIPPYSSCPWVILISSLPSTFPILFLPSPCLFPTYHLCYLFSVPFPPSPPPTPWLTTLHVISISMVLFLF